MRMLIGRRTPFLRDKVERSSQFASRLIHKGQLDDLALAIEEAPAPVKQKQPPPAAAQMLAIALLDPTHDVANQARRGTPPRSSVRHGSDFRLAYRWTKFARQTTFA
ncbi:MAG: hypothetical protein P0Y59_23080 [Candidatus Sphingomonas phytovorans]|nr:hypothetical protein [Sphingomonas sp.]WEJ99753.1 MAG: hypothetical protein P0Y59_23080 [Sphingomonas sp.]